MWNLSSDPEFLFFFIRRFDHIFINLLQLYSFKRENKHEEDETGSRTNMLILSSFSVQFSSLFFCTLSHSSFNFLFFFAFFLFPTSSSFSCLNFCRNLNERPNDGEKKKSERSIVIDAFKFINRACERDKSISFILFHFWRDCVNIGYLAVVFIFLSSFHFACLFDRSIQCPPQ